MKNAENHGEKNLILLIKQLEYMYYVVSAGVVPVACAGQKQWLSLLQKYVGCRHIETLFIFVIKLFIFHIES